MTQTDLPATRHFLLTGLFLIILGAIAVASPAMAGTAVVLVIGVILVGAGLVQIVQGFRAGTWSDCIGSLLFGVIAAACGVGVLGHPLLGLHFLTLLLAVYFVTGGVFKILGSFFYGSVAGWALMFCSGLVSLLLAVIILRQWPVSGTWAVGLLVGIDLLVMGVARVALAASVRRVDKFTTHAGAA